MRDKVEHSHGAILEPSAVSHGDALAWYTRVVLPSSTWSIYELNTELADYVFAPTYRATQLAALSSTVQGTFEPAYLYPRRLGDLLALSGAMFDTSVHRQVQKLWQGLQPDLGEKLWEAHLLGALDGGRWSAPQRR